MYKNKLPAYRKLAGLSQADMARALGLSRQRYNAYDQGKVHPRKYLEKILEVIRERVSKDIDLHDIFEPS